MKGICVAILIVCLSFNLSSAQKSIYVDGSKSNGNGSLAQPFNNIEDALDIVGKGDTVNIYKGTYNLSRTLETQRDGEANQRITIRAYEMNYKPILTIADRVMDVYHAYYSFQNLVFDAQFSNEDIIRVRSTGNHLILKDCEIRNAQKDGIDISSGDSVLIDGCEIHHLLAGTFNNQVDGHGIVATGQKNLRINNCNIYYCSGDCFQTDPNRGYPLWDKVVIENTKMWTGPLPENAAGWLKGESPGENAIDTKINESEIANGYRPVLVLNNIEAWGWDNNNYISLRAAFNIKEQVECIMDGIICHDNQLAFRLRGPGSRGGAYVTLKNVLCYNNDISIRPEDNIEQLHIYNSTFSKADTALWFQEAGGGYNAAGFKMLNCLFLDSKPSQANVNSNYQVDSTCFINYQKHDYHLKSGCSVIDQGIDIVEVKTDLDGNPRVSGLYDVGAYEYQKPAFIQSYNNASALSIYPNPIKSEDGNLTISSYMKIVEVTVVSLDGKTVVEQSFQPSNKLMIDIAELGSGIYTVRAKNEEQAILYSKIMIW